MAYTFATSTPATGAEAIFRLKAALVAAGWTVTRSSDGTTYNSSGDQITIAGSGAGGMANNSAWFVVRQPGAVSGATRELMFQRTTSNLLWTVFYSYSAGFTTGGSATVASTASDGQMVTPITGTRLFSTDGLYRCNICSDNASPYGWYLSTWPTGGGTSLAFLSLDPLVSGTYDSGDTDPYIIELNNVGTGVADPPQVGVLTSFAADNNAAAPRAWVKKGLAGEAFVVVTPMYYQVNGNVVAPGALPAHPISSKDELLPILYARRTGLSTSTGLKGMSSLFKWVGANRAAGDTFTVSTTRDWVGLGLIAVPWDGSVPTV